MFPLATSAHGRPALPLSHPRGPWLRSGDGQPGWCSEDGGPRSAPEHPAAAAGREWRPATFDAAGPGDFLAVASLGAVIRGARAGPRTGAPSGYAIWMSRDCARGRRPEPFRGGREVEHHDARLDEPLAAGLEERTVVEDLGSGAPPVVHGAYIIDGQRRLTTPADLHRCGSAARCGAWADRPDRHARQAARTEGRQGLLIGHHESCLGRKRNGLHIRLVRVPEYASFVHAVRSGTVYRLRHIKRGEEVPIHDRCSPARSDQARTETERARQAHNLCRFAVTHNACQNGRH